MPTGAPTQLLSQAGVLISQSAIDNMFKAAAANTLTLRLVDITPGANIAYHLREWAGEYKISNEGCPSGVMLVTFDDTKVFKACSDQLAGGIRGVFRVERGSGKPTAAAAAAGDGSSAAAAAARRRAAAPKPAAAAPAAAAGWQTVSSSRNRSTAAAAVAAPPPDPWADDDQSAASAAAAARSAAAAAAPVVDDWEEQLDAEVDVPRGPALKLEQRNMWDALGDDD